MSTHSTIAAGIDVSKHKLDVVVLPSKVHLEVPYDAAGLKRLDGFLAGHGVERVGFESSGGYEWRLLVHLRKGPVAAARFMAGQVKAFARSRLERAKNDRRDALTIAAFTASLDELPALPDEKYDGLAERLTYIEQIEDQIMRLKTMLETTRDKRAASFHKRDIAMYEKRREREIERLRATVAADAHLARKLELIDSVKGVGLRTALSICIRMPQIGSMTREEAGAMPGVAPWDDDSGTRNGPRHVGGGNARLRKSLFMAAFAATRFNPDIKAFYTRLRKAGKPHVLANVAAARKLIVLINAVVRRDTPWTPVKGET